jgi:DNA-binding cell septation regulator SpoVG
MKSPQPTETALRRPEAAASGGAPPGAAPAHRAETRGQGRLKKWIPHRSGAMLGFCAVELASGMVINNLRLMTGKSGPWVAMPAQKQLDRDGQPRADVNGKPIYSQLIEFRDRATADRFSAMVISLLEAVHPDTLTDGRAQ